MILQDKKQRVVLWGVTVEKTHIRAELAYFGISLYSDEIRLSDRDETIYKVKLPQKVLLLSTPARANKIALSIIP